MEVYSIFFELKFLLRERCTYYQKILQTLLEPQTLNTGKKYNTGWLSGREKEPLECLVRHSL